MPTKCPHGRRRHWCKDCGGKGICEHKRVRYSCKDCGGAGICEHKRQRYSCKDCGGAGICEHKRHRNQCKDCGGSGICEHKRVRHLCKDCGGAGICEHKRQRYSCKDCGGSSICEHKRQRNQCQACGGAGICEHKRLRRQCKDCVSIDQAQDKKRFCKHCCNLLSPKRVRLGVRECASCDARKPPRIEHMVVAKLMELVNWPIHMKDDTLIGGAACGQEQQRRPDTLWLKSGIAVFVEVDENGGHPERETSCETAKVENQTTAIKALVGSEDLHVFFLRFNPDQYDGPGNVRLEERIVVVANEINRLLALEDLAPECPRGPFGAYVEFFYYHTACHKHIEAHQAATGSMSVTRVWPMASNLDDLVDS